MNNKEILEKVIQKAIDGGFVWQTQCSEPLLSLDGNSKLHQIPHLNIPTQSWLIFNHDFAKALWGESPKYCNSAAIGEPATQPIWLSSWKYNLQQMVISDDPIKYLGNNI